MFLLFDTSSLISIIFEAEKPELLKEVVDMGNY